MRRIVGPLALLVCALVPGCGGGGRSDGVATARLDVLVEANIGDGRLAVDAPVFSYDLAVAPDGDVLLAEGVRVRRVDARTGTIATVPETELPHCYTGEPAQFACRSSVMAVASDPHGRTYFAANDGRIYRIDPETGERIHVAGVLAPSCGPSHPPPAGPPKEVCFDSLARLAFDGAGNLLILDNGRLLRLDAAETIITPVTGFGGGPPDMPCPDDVPAIETCLGHVGGIGVDAAGGIFISADDLPVRRIDPATGVIHAVTGRTGHCDAAERGDGGPALAACLQRPGAVAVDRAGNVFVADSLDGRVRRIDGDTGTITSLVLPEESGLFVGALAIDHRDRLLALVGNAVSTGYRVVRFRHDDALETVAGNGSLTFCGEGGPVVDACVGYDVQIAVGPDDAIYLSDPENRRIRRIDLRGAIHTVAGGGSPLPPSDGACPDGIPAIASCLRHPYAFAVGASDTLYIVDEERIRRVDDDGVITTVVGHCVGGYHQPTPGEPAASACLSAALDVTLDPEERLTLVTKEHEVWRVDENGLLELLIPRPASCDRLPMTPPCFQVVRIAFDSSGNLYFTDVVRVWRRAAVGGEPVAIAGNGSYGFDGDGGPAVAASLSALRIVVDAEANVFVSGEGSVRRIDAATGIVTTVAGAPGDACRTIRDDTVPIGSSCASLHAIDGAGRILYPEMDVEARQARVVRLTVPTGRPIP